MSKLACRCGHIISDTTDGLPYRADFLPNVHEENFFEGLSGAAQSFVAAIAEDDRESWLRRQGFTKAYPRDLPVAEVFSDVVSSLWRKYSRTCYECTACGRLYVQERAQSNAFTSFAPESGTYEGVLQSTIREA
jgi:hypothetical protein